MKQHRAQSGFSLVEILVAVSVIGIVLGAAVGSLGTSQELVHIGRNKNSALGYMSEYYEYVKNIKRYDWDLLTNGRYVVVMSGNDMVLQTTVAGETLNGFTRYIDIDTAYRDSSGALTTDPSQTPDESVKRITVTVSWGGIRPGTLSNAMYVTRYLDNLSWEQTTESDFNAGTHTGTTVVNNSGGEVQLGAGGSGNWCDPELSFASMNLPKNGEARSVSAIEGRAFSGTGLNASGVSFIDIGISNNTPPVLTQLGTVDGYKTNDVFGDSGYGYMATDNNSKEVVIVSLSTYAEVGYFNAPESDNAVVVYVAGNTGYTITGDTLYNFDLSSKAGSRPGIDTNGVNLGDEGRSVVVSGQYAYVATDEDDRQLQIIDLSVPTNMRVVGHATLNGGNGRDVYVNPTATRAYVVTQSVANKDEFFIVDITTKTGNRPVIGSENSQGMDPKTVEVVPGNIAIMAGVGGVEYQVLDIGILGSESNPLPCGSLDVNDNIYDSDSVLELDNDAYTYIVTGNSSSEFRVVQGGPGGAYATSGVFESSTFDPGRDTIAFNQFVVNHTEPINTSVRYQVALVDGGASGGCNDAVFNDFTFVGPDGTSASFFTTGGVIPTNDDGSNFENPGMCFRYRVYLDTTDFVSTPTFSDITVNYSP